jgi:hypothetical protein
MLYRNVDYCTTTTLLLLLIRNKPGITADALAIPGA